MGKYSIYKTFILHNLFFFTFQLLCAKFLIEKIFYVQIKFAPQEENWDITYAVLEMHLSWLFFL